MDKETVKRSMLSYAQTLTNLKRKTATEYAGPCPLCGGTDRFVVFDDDNPGWLCRNCHPDRRGDIFSLAQAAEGLSYPEALRKFGVDMHMQERQDTWARKDGDEWQHYPINATYNYCDLDGDVLFQVVRYTTANGSEKNFGQRQPDASRRSGWRQGTRGVRAVPYRLPEMRKANKGGETIYIVEGEKACDYLLLQGFAATTNIGGCGMGKKVYTPEYCEWFRDAHVVIVADNDAAGQGQEHARMIAERLDGIAASIEVRKSGSWEEAKGQGLDDWLALDGMIENLPLLDEEAVPDDKTEELAVFADVRSVLDACGIEVIALNELNQQIEVHMKDGAVLPINDGVHSTIRSRARQAGYGSGKRGAPPIGMFDDGLLAFAYSNRKNSIREYFEALPGWDGEDRIMQLWRCFVTENDLDIHYSDGTQRVLSHAYLRRWLIGVIGKALHGRQAAMLVLSGKQGIGKSSLLAWLAPEPALFRDTKLDLSSKDSDIALASHLIWEIGELSGWKGASQEALKAFISRTQISQRMPYARHSTTLPARAALAGTTNEQQFLTDDTGNRRYMIIELASIDWQSYLAIDKQQLWSQVLHLANDGEACLPIDVECMAQEQHNARYEMREGVFDYVYAFVEHTGSENDYVSIGELQAHINYRLSMNAITERHIRNRSVATALRRLGAEVRKTKHRNVYTHVRLRENPDWKK